jgi:hypothetical protein
MYSCPQLLILALFFDASAANIRRFACFLSAAFLQGFPNADYRSMPEMRQQLAARQHRSR